MGGRRIEAKALGGRFKAVARKLAKEALAEGQKKGAAQGGKTAGRGRPIASGETFPKAKRDESKRTRSNLPS